MFHLARQTPDGRLTPIQGLKGAETIDELREHLKKRPLRDSENRLVVVQVVADVDIQTTVEMRLAHLPEGTKKKIGVRTSERV